jgi:23S rRNA pseudouridine1911/1915/1917 synthase
MSPKNRQADILINASRRGDNLIIAAGRLLAGYGTPSSFIGYIFDGAPDKITAMAKRCRIIINPADGGCVKTVDNGGPFSGGAAGPDTPFDGFSSFLFVDFFAPAKPGGAGTNAAAEPSDGPSDASFNYSDIKFSVEYEDDFLAVINKPAGVKIHSDGTGTSDSLSDAVNAYFTQKSPGGRAYPVHRLDIGTSGLIVFAKDNITCAILDRAIFENRLLRRYTAVIEGAPAAREGVINLAIGRDRHNSNRYRVSKTGKTAVTDYKVIKTDRRRNISFIEASLATGRTHQIRVHFSHIGHPLAGDTLYGGGALKSGGFFASGAKAGNDRDFLLHSSYIYFIHPYSKKIVELNSPPDFM